MRDTLFVLAIVLVLSGFRGRRTRTRMITNAVVIGGFPAPKSRLDGISTRR